VVAADSADRPALTPVEILVVGAGPVGLTLALQAHLHGARVTLVERRARPERPSRAMLLWPRTLVCLGRLGLAGELQSHPAARLRAVLHVGRRVVGVALAELAAPGGSGPPLMVRQADLEAMLRRAVLARGMPLLTGAELVGLEVDGDGATATVRMVAAAASPTTQEVTCRFVVGCDGADSAVRHLAGIPWRGRTYPEEAVLADLDADDLPTSTAHIGAGRAGIGFLFPAGEHGADWRLVATRLSRAAGAPPGRDGPALQVDELQGVLSGANLPGRVTAIRWSTRVRLQRRRAGAYRVGPVFLAGDAAHVFSPAGAQGLNTGLQDATNLGWKLAIALRGSGDPAELLTSYQSERMPVARRVGALTGLLLRGEGDERLPFRLVRAWMLPVAAPAVPGLLRLRPLTAAAGWVLSQGWVGYRTGPLTHGGARPWDRLRPGSFAPDLQIRVEGRRTGLHDLTSGPGVHLLHGRTVHLGRVRDLPGVRAHQVDDWAPTRVVGLRPDGYVGYSDRSGSLEPVYRWLQVVTGDPDVRRRMTHG